MDAPCTASLETCDGSDEDCDGRLDEDFDRDTDLAHCGACGRACVSGDRGTPACRAGECAVDCDPGFADCDGEPSNGCEASLSAASNCGRCNLGNGAAAASDTPGPVLGITNAIDLAVGEVHACAALSDGTVRCWGENGRRQLGDAGLP